LWGVGGTFVIGKSKGSGVGWHRGIKGRRLMDEKRTSEICHQKPNLTACQ